VERAGGGGGRFAGEVDGSTAWIVLMVWTVLFLISGMVVFSRAEYHEVS